MPRQSRPLVVASAALVVFAVCTVVLARVRGGESSVREIRLVAREMTFVDAATGEANPTLTLKRGERIRVVFTNEDPGYTHNVLSPVLGLSMPPVPAGTTGSVEVTVPDTPGRSTYACGPHAAMMRGNIAIE